MPLYANERLSVSMVTELRNGNTRMITVNVLLDELPKAREDIIDAFDHLVDQYSRSRRKVDSE